MRWALRHIAVLALLAYAGAGSLPCLGSEGAGAPARVQHALATTTPGAESAHHAHGRPGAMAHHAAAPRADRAQLLLAAPCPCRCDDAGTTGVSLARSGPALPGRAVLPVPRARPVHGAPAEPHASSADPAPIDHVPLTA